MQIAIGTGGEIGNTIETETGTGKRTGKGIEGTDETTRLETIDMSGEASWPRAMSLHATGSVLSKVASYCQSHFCIASRPTSTIDRRLPAAHDCLVWLV